MSRTQSTSLPGRLATAGAIVCCWLVSPVARGDEELKVAHILLRSRAQAEAVRKQIDDNGGDAAAFKKACYARSLDAGTKPLGGVLPTPVRKNGQYDKAFTAGAFLLKEGEISQPVKSEFGWHLIQVIERSEKGASKKTTAGGSELGPDGLPTDPIARARVIAERQAAAARKKAAEAAAAKNAAEAAAAKSATAGAKPGPNEVGPAIGPVERPKATAPKPVVAKRRAPTTGRRVHLVIESVKSQSVGNNSQRIFPPNQAVELNLTMRNEGAETVRVPHPSLVPLGFKISRRSDGQALTPDYTSMKEPEAFFATLRTWKITGEVVSLNDYFSTLSASGRFDLFWDGPTFIRNLEEKFPKVKDLPDYAKVNSELNSQNGLRVYNVSRDASPWPRKSSKPFNFSVFPRVEAKKKYYARLKFSNEESPVVFELFSKGRGNHTAVSQFVRLANEGFYDGLRMYDFRKGDYALGGCPLNNGFGVPAMLLPNRVANDDKTKHVRGTVSFVTRTSPRQGPVTGGDIGSIFFVSLKDHSEWDEDHVPFGSVVEGLDVFDRLAGTPRMEKVTILSETAYAGDAPAAVTPEASKTAVDGGDSKAVPSGVAEAVIKTAKGDLAVMLLEKDAYHTVASFVTLAESGFFDKGKEEGTKQKFFDSVEQGGKTIAIIAGSPTNDYDGGPGYKLRDEVNKNRCVKGALVMLKQLDEEGGYVPNSAGSSFFICLDKIEYYDFQGELTVFGNVKAGSFETLDKLVKGDEIAEVTITQKKSRVDYSKFTPAKN